MSCNILSDYYLFPALQIGLVVFALVCAILDRIHRHSAGVGGIGLAITRGPDSMATFYATYAVLTGVFVTLALTVDSAKDYRVLFVVLDTLLIAYVCLLNFWFRNKLVGWSNQLTNLEKR